MDSKKDDHSATDGGDLMGLINDTNADLDAVNKMMTEDADQMGDLDLDGLLDKEHGEEHAADDTNDLTFQPGEKVPSELAGKQLTMSATASFDTREGRAMLRAKLAADALGKQDDGEERDMSKEKFSPTLLEANKLTSGRDLELDTKPSDNLGLVETLPEQNKAFLDVAKMPPKVRKEAEVIQRLVSEGKLDPKDIDALVAEGLDKDAVSYWKKYYGEVDGGSEFASELVKEHVKASIQDELGKERVKLARAYELTYDMVDRGLCQNSRSAISGNVDLLMKSNDEGFESLKRVVAKHEPLLRKEASRLPQVGIREDVEYTPESAVETNEFEQLGSALGKRTRMF